jgi:protein TonB
LIATIDAADIAAAVDPLAEHIASDGEVLAQFVVDSSGRVDPATFKVLKSTAPAFTRAVQAFVGEMTFTPAEFRGRRVNQLVQMPFQFP